MKFSAEKYLEHLDDVGKEQFNDNYPHWISNVTPVAHSSYLYVDSDGGVSSKLSAVCLADITYSSKPISLLVIAFGSWFNKDKDKLLWVDYIINRSNYRDAFLTKDVEEGMEHGFFVDVTKPKYIVNAGLLAIRHQFEFEDWIFNEVLSMGFSEEESYMLSSLYVVYEGVVQDSFENSNHLVVRRDCGFGDYKIKGGIIPGLDKLQHKNLLKGYGDSSPLSGVWSSGGYHNCIGDEEVIANKENFTKLLNMRKG